MVGPLNHGLTSIMIWLVLPVITDTFPASFDWQTTHNYAAVAPPHIKQPEIDILIKISDGGISFIGQAQCIMATGTTGEVLGAGSGWWVAVVWLLVRLWCCGDITTLHHVLLLVIYTLLYFTIGHLWLMRPTAQCWLLCVWIMINQPFLTQLTISKQRSQLLDSNWKISENNSIPVYSKYQV